ncbi:MFS transporter [Streptomyces sp. YIM 98790]|uniref:MFS transporter n=1 Tax=Streptomyces sp. YIM 98790 TaxID=2689077 RepID=UPI00140B671B|nr:MFS transporter [Streptomyces sp. YIM 98790]
MTTLPFPARSHGLVRRLYLPRATDALSFSLATYGIPLLVLATTHSAALTGLAFALEWVPRLAAFALAGSLVDRHGPRTVFRTASAARAAAVAVAAAALATAPDQATAISAVMALAVVTGVLTEFSYIAAETAGAAASRAAGPTAHRVQSALLGIEHTALLAGPAFGGALLHWTGEQGMLATLTVLSALAALLPPRVPGQHRPEQPTAPVWSGLATGWCTLRALPTLAWLIAGMTLANLAAGVLQAATPIIVVQHFGHSPAAVGVIWSVAAGASLLAIAGARYALDRMGMWPVGAFCAAVAAAACLAVAHAGTYRSYLLLIAVLMAAEGGMIVMLRTLRARLIPPEVFGSTLALTILILLLPFPAAGIAVALTPAHHLGHLLTACALLHAAGLTAAFTRLRTDPALRTPAPAPTGAEA